VKFKKLAGGGYFKIINRMVPQALETLGYDQAQIDRIIRYAVGGGSLKEAPFINHVALASKGFDAPTLEKVEGSLGSAFDIRFVFNKFTLGEEFCIEKLGFTASSSTTSPSTCCPASASPRPRSTRPTPSSPAP